MLNSSRAIKSLAMLCLVAVSANATLELASEEYSYEEALQVTPTAVGGGLGSVIHLRVAPQAYVQYADVQVSAKDCSTDAYDCFESCTFSFAVPTMLITPNVNWSAGNRHYRVLRHYPVYQLGAKRIEDLYVIEGAALPCVSTPDVKARRLFYYSQENGLLGFVDLEAVGDAREPSVTMYLLKGDCGFASACSRTRQDKRAKK